MIGDMIMPRFKIETSLFDPLVIELGDKVYTSVPRSVQLTETVKDLDAERLAKKISDNDFAVQFLGLMFDVNPQEFRVLDRAIMEAIADRALDYVRPVTPIIPPTVAEQKIKDAVAEALDSKNGRKSEDEISH